LLFEITSILRSESKGPRKPNSAGETHPPSFRILSPPFTFEGEEYMKQNHSVSYELSEMAALKRMYVALSYLSPGKTVSLGEFESQLVHLGKAFKDDGTIRKNFREFAGKGFATIEAVANHFADHKIKAEDALMMVEEKAAGDSE
jgi:hypothetical protein